MTSRYNECDALSTYLLWLRAALLSGHLTSEAHAGEEERLERLLAERAALDGNGHLREYLAAWEQLRVPRPARAESGWHELAVTF